MSPTIFFAPRDVGSVPWRQRRCHCHSFEVVGDRGSDNWIPKKEETHSFGWEYHVDSVRKMSDYIGFSWIFFSEALEGYLFLEVSMGFCIRLDLQTIILFMFYSPLFSPYIFQRSPRSPHVFHNISRYFPSFPDMFPYFSYHFRYFPYLPDISQIFPTFFTYVPYICHIFAIYYIYVP